MWRELMATIERRRLARCETLVATTEYTTTIVDAERNPTGTEHVHIVTFLMDGNGRRYSRVSSGAGQFAEKHHNNMRRARARWEHHGDLPRGAERVGPVKQGKLIALDGGKK